ncbi:hypothetical protein NLU13_9818 [Sarocladium strictum]|uniref:Zn(2)-C6 fungal-type domain-containing protein n=1 Tax=Sarocladium strictum TaxID=5046 RepID=A0AA39GAS1_SARSR|nr:hypothetical protein NLU13_9818 [Sarocladium strictum]
MGRLNRRIPNELRKRTAQSCDLCKTRRCKCVPSGEGKACVSCLDQGVECQFTAPRKQRFYGSLDDLSDRYRCLEAIVRGLHPDDPITTPSDLLRLGQRLGCPMPDLSPAARKEIKLETLLRDPEAHLSVATPASESSTVATKHEPDSKRSDGSTGEDQGSVDNEAPSPALFKDPAGNEHYIGPSGTLNFLHQLRQVFVSAQGPPTAFGQQVASQIPTLNTAQTLEPADHAANASDQYGTPPNAVADWQEALSLLPHADVLDPLLIAYFSHTHEDFPLFHRLVFQDQCNFFLYNAGKSSQPPQRNDYPPQDWGWLGCLYMILVFGSIARPELAPVDPALLQKQYVAASRVLLPQLIAKCSLNNLRALILLALFLHNSNERNASWNLTGTAIRMAFAIGLHRKVQDAPYPETESRNLVLSTLYSFELFLAANLGRPSGLSETDVEVFPLPSAQSGHGSGTDPELIALTVGLNSILQRTRLMYTRRKQTYGGNSETTQAGGVDDIQDRLQRWRQDLKEHTQFDLPTIALEGRTGSFLGKDDPGMEYHELRQKLATQNPSHLRALFMLHVQFHYIGIITTRHFLLHDIAAARLNTSGNAESISTLAQSCLLHSHQLSYIFLLMDSFQLVNGRTGFDVFYGYWAGMLLNLMLLWPKSAKHLPSPGQPCPLRRLVRNVHHVVSRVDKSGTMQRLSSVMDAFVAWADSVNGVEGHTSGTAAAAATSQQTNGFTPLNGPAPPPPPPFPQQQHPATQPGADLPNSVMVMTSNGPMPSAAMSPWPTTQAAVASSPAPGINMGFMNLPPGGNGATAFLNSFLGPDDQAAMLGMIDADFATQGFRAA